jgi:glycine cleavage system aminomethyltransferase T
LPDVGTKIQSEGKDVGEVTSTASLPLPSGERSVALGYIRRESATSGQQLQSGETRLTAVSVPFEGVFPKCER